MLSVTKKVACNINTDDMGFDFMREMSFADAMANALATLGDAKKVAADSAVSISSIAKVFAQGAVKHHTAQVLPLEKKEQEVLRQYMRLGYVEDEVFRTLAQKWTTHSIKTRLQQMTKLALPPAIFLSSAESTKKCQSPDVDFEYFLAAMAGRKSVESALKYLFKKRCTRKHL